MDHFNLEKLLSIPLFFDFQLNYEKDKMSFYWDKTGRMEMYIMDMQTRTVEQVSNGEFPRDIKSTYVWGRDNETIVYAKDDSGSEMNDLFAFNIVTKKKSEVSVDPNVQEYIADSSPDGKWYVINSIRGGQMNLFKIKTDGSDVQQLTAHENPAMGGQYSSDGKWIAYTVNEESHPSNWDIYLVDADGGTVERAVHVKEGSQDFLSKWAPDGKSFAFVTDAEEFNRPGIYDLETKSYRMLGDKAYNESPVAFSIDSTKLFCLVNNESSISPSMYDLNTGERKVFKFPKGIATGGQITKDDKIVMVLNTPSKPSSLVLFDPETEEIETLLEPDFGDIDASLFVDNEYIRYLSTFDAQIPAMVYKPRDWDTSKSYPGIVWAHGGPTAQYFNVFMAMGQYYADNGFVVIFPNVRGSTGYGAEFRDACLNDWGGKDLDDWVAARQYLIDHCAVDANRVAIRGGSYGGYATLISVGKRPELWKLGVAVVPVSNMLTLYEEDLPHFKYYLRTQMGDPVKDKDLWIERSPITYADKVTAKMLLVQGENDPRCPVSQSRDYIAALKAAGRKEGVDYEYVEIKDQGHGMFTDRNSRIRDAKTASSYILKHL